MTGPASDAAEDRDDEAIAREVAERDANDTGERITVEELAASVGLPVPPSDAATKPRFWRMRWWWARTFKTHDYWYVVNSNALDEEEYLYGRD